MLERHWRKGYRNSVESWQNDDSISKFLNSLGNQFFYKNNFNFILPFRLYFINFIM